MVASSFCLDCGGMKKKYWLAQNWNTHVFNSRARSAQSLRTVGDRAANLTVRHFIHHFIDQADRQISDISRQFRVEGRRPLPCGRSILTIAAPYRLQDDRAIVSASS